MSKLIEVIHVRDSAVIDGIIHGAHHRNKEAADKMREARKQNQSEIFEQHKHVLNTHTFVYVDVTEKSAESALFAKLRRDPSAIKAVGIHNPQRLRGATYNGVNVIMSESLQVIDATELSNSLEQMFKVIRIASTATFPIRVYVPVEFSEKFDACMESWIIKDTLENCRSCVSILTGVSDENVQTLALDTLMGFFSAKADSIMLRHDAWKINSELEFALSDLMISRIENIMRGNKATLYLSRRRFDAYALGKYYRSSGVTV